MAASKSHTFQDAAAAAAVGLAVDNRDGRVWCIEIATTGLSGTIDIQGAMEDTDAQYANLRYAPLQDTGALGYVVAQLSYTTNTTRLRYVVDDFWPYIRVKLTSRTAGSVTARGIGTPKATA